MGLEEQFKENRITGKLDEVPTADENLALSDLLQRGERITIDEMRQLNRPQIEGKLSPGIRAVLGPNPAFILENAWGDKRREDEKGNVTSFTYVDKVGNEVHKLDHVMRDSQGKVIRFDDSKGRRWERQNYLWEPDAQMNIWVAINRATNEKSQSTYDLGDVKVDKEGVHVTGTNPSALNIPKRRVVYR
jgi:hypothetical protein